MTSLENLRDAADAVSRGKPRPWMIGGKWSRDEKVVRGNPYARELVELPIINDECEVTDDHDSHEWAKARSVECDAVMAVLQDRFIGRPIALSHDGDVKNMRHSLAILLHEAFPGVEFNIRARMPIHETVVRMKEIR